LYFVSTIVVLEQLVARLAFHTFLLLVYCVIVLVFEKPGIIRQKK